MGFRGKKEFYFGLVKVEMFIRQPLEISSKQKYTFEIGRSWLESYI